MQLDIGAVAAAATAGLPRFDKALLHSPSHLSDCIGDFISRRVGKTHIQETSAKQVSMKLRCHKLSFTKLKGVAGR